jgi:hypothetical protein
METVPSGSARSYHSVNRDSKEEGQEVAALRVSEQAEEARSPETRIANNGKGRDWLHASREVKGHVDGRGTNGMGESSGKMKEMERESLGNARFTLVDVESDEEMDVWPDEDRSAALGTENAGVSHGKGEEQNEQTRLDSRKESSEAGSSGYDSDDEDVMGLDGDMFVKHKVGSICMQTKYDFGSYFYNALSCSLPNYYDADKEEGYISGVSCKIQSVDFRHKEGEWISDRYCHVWQGMAAYTQETVLYWT